MTTVTSAKGSPQPIRALPNAATGTPVRRLAKRLDMERSCDPDRDSMLAALRVALGLPRVLPAQREAA